MNSEAAQRRSNTAGTQPSSVVHSTGSELSPNLEGSSFLSPLCFSFLSRLFINDNNGDHNDDDEPHSLLFPLALGRRQRQRQAAIKEITGSSVFPANSQWRELSGLRLLPTFPCGGNQGARIVQRRLLVPYFRQPAATTIDFSSGAGGLRQWHPRQREPAG
nr:hypothetical protein Itr_chr15CG12140 [Ipomoea trifida]